MAERLVLAIDPGPTQSAFVLWNGSRVIACGWEPNENVRSVIAVQCHACTVAIEGIASYGMAVGAEVFDTCYQIGRMIEVTDGQAVIVLRREVKLHLCGSARAKDPNVRQALIDRFGPPGTKANPGPLYGCKSHVWSALAVAVTAWDGAASATVAGSGGAAKVAGGRGQGRAAADSNTGCNARVLPVRVQGGVPSEHLP